MCLNGCALVMRHAHMGHCKQGISHTGRDAHSCSEVLVLKSTSALLPSGAARPKPLAGAPPLVRQSTRVVLYSYYTKNVWHLRGGVATGVGMEAPQQCSGPARSLLPQVKKLEGHLVGGPLSCSLDGTHLCSASLLQRVPDAPHCWSDGDQL